MIPVRYAGLTPTRWVALAMVGSLLATRLAPAPARAAARRTWRHRPP
jgi:hypothetical protein